MNIDFVHSKNFKTRLITGVLLASIVIASLLTPHANMFRILFLVGGTMAGIELFMAQRSIVYREIPMRDDRIVAFEYVVIIAAIYAISFYLDKHGIILVLLGAISADSFAYFAGSALHDRFFKTRPFPKTSPKKSWEGILGGCIGCILTLIIAIHVMGLEFTAPVIVFIATCPIVSIFGDYLASFCKRFLKIKDSGDGIMDSNLVITKQLEKLMSGHGGFLDRIDSISMVACLMFWIELITNPH